MTKQMLIDTVAEQQNLTKAEATRQVTAVFAAMTTVIADTGALRMPYFGTFTVKDRAARQGHNPQTGKAITIAAKRVVGFKAASELSSRVN